MKRLLFIALTLIMWTESAVGQVPATTAPQLFPGNNAWYGIDNDVVLLPNNDFLKVATWVQNGALPPSIMVSLNVGFGGGAPVILNVTAFTGAYDRFADIAITHDGRYAVIYSQSLSGVLHRTIIPINQVGLGVYAFGIPSSTVVSNNITSFSGVETDHMNRMYGIYVDAGGDLILDYLMDHNAFNPINPANWQNLILEVGPHYTFGRYTISTLSSNPNSRLIRHMGRYNNMVRITSYKLGQVSPTNFVSAPASPTVALPLNTLCSFSLTGYGLYYKMDISAPYKYDDGGGIQNDHYFAAITYDNCGVQTYTPFGPPTFTTLIPNTKADEIELIYSDYCNPKYVLSTSRSFNIGGATSTFDFGVFGNVLLPYFTIDNQIPGQYIMASIANDEGYIGLAGVWNNVPGLKLRKCLPTSTWSPVLDDPTTFENNDQTFSKNPQIKEEKLWKLQSSINPSSTIFPNPASNTATIQLQDLESPVQSIDLYNSLGQKVFSYQPNGIMESNTYQIDVSEFISGIYLVNVVSENNAQTYKLKVVH